MKEIKVYCTEYDFERLEVARLRRRQSRSSFVLGILLGALALDEHEKGVSVASTLIKPTDPSSTPTIPDAQLAFNPYEAEELTRLSTRTGKPIPTAAEILQRPRVITTEDILGPQRTASSEVQNAQSNEQAPRAEGPVDAE